MTTEIELLEGPQPVADFNDIVNDIILEVNTLFDSDISLLDGPQSSADLKDTINNLILDINSFVEPENIINLLEGPQPSAEIKSILNSLIASIPDPSIEIPPGAISFLDFLNGFYYAGGEERVIGDVLTGTPNIVTDEGALIDGQGTPWWPVATGTLLTDIGTLADGAGVTIVAEFKPPNFTGRRSAFIVRGDGGDNAFDGATTNTDGFGESQDASSGDATTDNAATADAVNKMAVTFVGGEKLAVSLNGGTVASDTTDIQTITATSSVGVGHRLEEEPIGYLRTFTIYPAVADAALPGLSAL